MNHTIFNERPESQDRMIRMLTQMGYEYVSRSDAEEKRGNLSSVVFEDELRSFLNAQQYTFRGKEYHFSAESVTRAIRELDASLLQGLLMASKDVYNHLTGGISVEEKLFVEGDTLLKYAGTHFPIVVSREMQKQPCPICGEVNDMSADACHNCGLSIIKTTKGD